VFRIGVLGEARFLSHLETMNAWVRALRRCRTPLVYSEGFHPHPKLAFSGARPVGEQTLGDYMDITLNERIDPGVLLAQLQATVPPGFKVFAVRESALKAPSLMSIVAGADYRFVIDAPPEDLAARAETLLAQEQIWVERRTKNRRKRRRQPTTRIDLRPNLISMVVGDVSTVPVEVLEGAAVLDVRLQTTDEGRGAKPSEVLELLGLDPERVQVVRLDTRFRDTPTLPPSAKEHLARKALEVEALGEGASA
jgi:radical SAM-linked protein